MDTTLSLVCELAPTIRKRADEIEQARRVPADIVEALARAGALRMLVPAAYGGDELPFETVLRVVEELAVADGSTGWLVGQICLSQLIFAALPDRARAEIYAHGPDVFGAGAVAPKGRAAPDGEGGWRVNGQWPFVTGAPQSSWVYLNCVVLDGHRPQVTADGVPLTRIVVVPAAELEIIDTWQVLGLRATASQDVRAPALTAPDWRGFSLVDDTPQVRRAVFAFALAGLLISAVGLGLASGAVGEVAELAAAGKRRAFSPRSMAASPVFQDRLGEAYVTVRAARALLTAEARTAWAAMTSGEAASPMDRACLRATASRITALATEAIDTAHALAGGQSVYDGAPLQRRLRDIHTATQHFVNGRDFFATVGALLAGEEVDSARF